MKILIKKDAYKKYNQFTDFGKLLKEISGTWVDVETEHLFDNQFNTKDLRIYRVDVESIQDDARIGLLKCGYCGRNQHKLLGKTCRKCGNDGYMSDLMKVEEAMNLKESMYINNEVSNG